MRICFSYASHCDEKENVARLPAALQNAEARSLKGFVALLWSGALAQYVPSLGLMNRKLPFGLAETGLCYRRAEGHHDSDASGW